MAKDIFYTAVDIGTHKVCSIVARIGTEGELKILGTGLVPSQGMQKGRIENIEEVQESVRSSLAEAQRYIARGVITGVYAGVSGTHVTCLNTNEVFHNPGDVGSISTQQMKDLIQASCPDIDSAQEVLHIIPIGYEVDGLPGVRNPVGLHAKQVRVEAHVVLGDAPTLKNTVKVVEASKVSVNSLVLQSLASAESTLSGDEREIGVVLADIGAGTTDVAIFRQGNPWYSAVIPVGGNQLTRDLAVALRVPYYLAEEIKVKKGHAVPEMVPADEEVIIPSFQGQPRRVVKRRALCEPLHLRATEIIKLILLETRKAGLRQLPNGGVVITGGAAELPGFSELIENMIGGQVRVAYPRGIAGLPAQLQKPAFATAVGTLLWGIKHQGESRPYHNGERTLRGYKSLLRRFSRSLEKVTG